MASLPSINVLVEPIIIKFIGSDEASTPDLVKKIRVIIEDQSQIIQSQSALGNLYSRLIGTANDLISHDNREGANPRLKLAGLAIFDVLLDTNDENTTDRRIEILTSVKKLLESESKLATEAAEIVLRQAAQIVGHFSRIASAMEVEFLQNIYLTAAFRLIANSRSPQNRLAGALILTQLSLNSPALIFSKRKDMFLKVWDCVVDKISIVRRAAAEALEAGLQLVSQREEMSDYLRQALKIIKEGLPNSASERVIGSLLILDIIIGGVVVSLVKLRKFLVDNRQDFGDLIWKVLSLRESEDQDIKSKVICIIPQLANAFSATFLERNAYTVDKTFLVFSVEYLLDVINKKRCHLERAYISLGQLFIKCVQLRTMSLTTKIFSAIQDGFRVPFCTQALQCLGMVVSSAPSSRSSVTTDLVDQMFTGGITPDLIDALKIITKHVHAVRSHVQRQLRVSITQLLQGYTVVVDDVPLTPTASVATTSSTAASGRSGTLRLFRSKLVGTAGGGAGGAAAAGGGGGGSMAATAPKTTKWGGGLFSSTTAEAEPAPTGSINADAQLILAFQVLASPDFFPKRIRQRFNSSSELLSMSSLSLTDPGDVDSATSLLEVVSTAVVRYLDDINPEIRGAAACTCLTVLDTVILQAEPGSGDYNSIISILDRLFIIGIGDDSADIRCKIFSTIGSSLDPIVSQSENLYCLVEGLNDESVEVRSAAMLAFARASHFDALRIMPTVLVTMEQLIKLLQFSRDHQIRLESVQLLQAMVKGVSSLIVPYVDQLLAPLLNLLKEPSAAIVGSALSTIGELAVAAPESVTQYLERLFPRLIEALNDVSSVSTQEIAVVAMGKLVSSLALLTEEPYSKFPSLFSGLVRAIQNEEVSSQELRLQAIKTVGLLGAVDVNLYQAHLSSYAGTVGAFSSQPQEDEDMLGVGGEVSPVTALKDDEKRLSKVERYYVSVVIRELTSILRDASLASFHQQALTIAVKVVRDVGPQAFPYIGDLVKGIVYRMYQVETSHNMRDALLDHLSSMIHIVGRPMRKHQEAVVKLITDFFETHLKECLDLLESIYVVFSVPDFTNIFRSISPIMLQIIRDEPLGESFGKAEEAAVGGGSTGSGGGGSSLLSLGAAGAGLSMRGDRSGSATSLSKKSQLPKTMRILQNFANMKENIGEFRKELALIVIFVFDNVTVATESRRFAVRVFLQLVNDAELLELSNRVVQPLMRMVVINSEPSLQSIALSALSAMLCRLGINYVPFIIPVRRATRAIAPRADGTRLEALIEYETLAGKLLKQRPLPPAATSGQGIAVHDTIQRRMASSRKEGQHQIGMQALEFAWALANRDNASDLSDWMQRLSVEFIRQSPSPIIRVCSLLTKVYRPLAEQLFNASFNCLWDELYAGDNIEVIDDIPLINGIEMALSSSQIPNHITLVLLNLAEFMDMQDKRLPIDVKLLAKQAEAANMFAKCLRYREMEFNSVNISPSSECVEALITVNNELGLHERATGVLNFVMANYSQYIEIKPLWLEILNYWDDAKQSYLQQNFTFRERFPRQSPATSPEWMAGELGVLRCYHALGEFEELTEEALTMRDFIRVEESDQAIRAWNAEVQNLGANAAWMLGQWDVMANFVASEPTATETHDIELTNNSTFFRAVLAIHKHQYDEALSLVAETRSNLSEAISTLLSESYSRAYRAMVSMQVLAEMEEVVEYKQMVARAAIDRKTLASVTPEESMSMRKSTSDPYLASASKAASASTSRGVDLAAAKAALGRKWRGRLKWVPKEIDMYRQVLAVHTLVFDPREDLDGWLELVTLCTKEKMFSLCGNLLRRLGAPLVFMPAVVPSSSEYVTPTSTPPPPTKVLTPVPFSSIGTLPSKPHHRVLFATYKYLWASGERHRALQELSDFLEHDQDAFEDQPNSRTASVVSSPESSEDRLRLFRVKCLLRRSQWMRELGESPFEEVLKTVMEARQLAPDEYSAWHAWAVTNYDQLRLLSGQDTTRTEETDAQTRLNRVPSHSSINEMLRMRQESPDASGGSTRKLLFSSQKTISSSGSSLSSLGGLGSLGGIIGPTPQKRKGSGTNYLTVEIPQEVDAVTPFVVEAIKGFVRSIVLGQGQPIANLLQDTLRLLTLWFNYGTRETVFNILNEELDKISPENWLGVVPQLIARMHVKSPQIAGLLHKILIKLAGTHPQALVCPISVALNTNNLQQKKIASQVVSEMRKLQTQLVEEATLVSRELMRVAMTPHEIWHDGLELAAQQYMEFKDIPAMMETLKGLHEAMDDSTSAPPSAPSSSSSSGGAGGSSVFDASSVAAPATSAAVDGFAETTGKVSHSTLRDISFRQAYGRQLAEAKMWLDHFMLSRKILDLHQAWEVYQVIFKKIKAQIKSFKSVELHHVSPALTQAVNLRLAVPGTYRPFVETISIRGFSASIEVIASKQRPRRMSVTGSDGVTYQFLLKGHEDLRQDERVMQLFGLINVCLDNDRSTQNRGLSIVRYSVLPLSNNSGVIGWVENCDTLNSLVKQYRELKNVRLDIENKLLRTKCPHYLKLPLINKVEAFTQVLEETSGQDIARMLWLTSKTADTWVERRASFTKSMAVMSMVGYILGLGDRHPSNLMVDRVSGRVVHIDFGDCFEVTSKRAKFPEIIPFRLTRMLMEAMEKSGIEGTYRVTSERIMRVMRDNRDSVMAMLEAFVYDPLISWRLLGSLETEDPAIAGAVGATSSDDSDHKTSMQKMLDETSSDEVEHSGTALIGALEGDGDSSPTLKAVTSHGDNADWGAMGDESDLVTAAPPVAAVAASMLDKARRATLMDQPEKDESLNARALEVITRIQAKLTGRDFAKCDDDESLSAGQQVDRLIKEATSLENLCQLYQGWCPMW